MYFLRDVCPVDVLRTVYFSLMNSRLEYGIVCWGGSYFSNIYPIVTQQKQIMRIIMRKACNEHSFPLFLHLKILPLRHLFIFKVLIMFYKKSGNSPMNDGTYHSRLRRHDHFDIPRPYLTFFQKTFDYLAPKLFNLLPQNIKNIKTINSYKKLVKDWLLMIDDIETLVNVR